MSVTVREENPVVASSLVNQSEFAVYRNEERSASAVVYRCLRSLLGYNIGLIFGLLAALVGAVAVGVLFSGATTLMYDLGLSYGVIPAPGANVSGAANRFDLAMNGILAGGSFGAAFAFCVTCLHVFPHKGQVQSVAVLALTALPGIFAIAGDTLNTRDYTGLLAGTGALVAIALLIFRFPHWVYLTHRVYGD